MPTLRDEFKGHLFANSNDSLARDGDLVERCACLRFGTAEVEIGGIRRGAPVVERTRYPNRIVVKIDMWITQGVQAKNNVVALFVVAGKSRDILCWHVPQIIHFQAIGLKMDGGRFISFPVMGKEDTALAGTNPVGCENMVFYSAHF